MLFVDLRKLSIMEKVKPQVKSVAVACCTYKRPEKLRCLLSSLVEMKKPDVPTKILIVDNDIEQSSKPVVDEFLDKLNIHYVVEKNKGLSNARNGALKGAIELGVSHIAFVDDDETVDENWLVTHIDFYNQFENIYISNGPAYSIFKENTPDYVKKCTLFAPYVCKKLGKIKKTCPSNNVFMPIDIVKDNDVYFSTEFNSSGGEDTDFFGRLTALGFNIGWNYNAKVYEIVEESRTDFKWLMKKAYNNGLITGCMKAKKNKNAFKKALYILDKLIKVVVFAILAVPAILFGMSVFTNSLVRLFSTVGLISGVMSFNKSDFYG